MIYRQNRKKYKDVVKDQRKFFIRIIFMRHIKNKNYLKNKVTACTQNFNL